MELLRIFVIISFTNTVRHSVNDSTSKGLVMAMFTLYRIVKRNVTESVPDRASVHTRNAALLRVERSVSDRFLKRSESSVNTFIGAEIATEPRFGK